MGWGKTAGAVFTLTCAQSGRPGARRVTGLGQSVAVAKQTMPVECRDLTVEDYFISQFQDIDQVRVLLTLPPWLRITVRHGVGVVTTVTAVRHGVGVDERASVCACFRLSEGVC